jgi:hypothetical protein
MGHFAISCECDVAQSYHRIHGIKDRYRTISGQNTPTIATNASVSFR